MMLTLYLFYPMSMLASDINIITNLSTNTGNNNIDLLSIYTSGNTLYNSDRDLLYNYNFGIDYGLNNPGNFLTNVTSTQGGNYILIN